VVSAKPKVTAPLIRNSRKAWERCVIYFKKTENVKMKENLGKTEHLKMLENLEAQEISKNFAKIGYRKLGYTEEEIIKIMGVEKEQKQETKNK